MALTEIADLPVTKVTSGSNYGSYFITFGGVKYYQAAWAGPSGAKVFTDLPAAQLTEIANWNIANASSTENGQAGAAKAYLAGTASSSNVAAMVYNYAESSKPLSSAGPLPGEGAASSAVAGVESVTDFLSKLSSGALWLKVAEVAIGVILIAIGVAHVTGAQNVVSKAAGAALVA